MRKVLLYAVLLWVSLLVPPALAAGFAGTWQTTIIDDDGKSLRTILRIDHVGGWTAAIYVIDVNPAGFLSDSVTVEGDRIKIVVRHLRGTFDGTLSADGNSISGAWTGEKTRPLILGRATPETAWPLDTSPHETRFVTTSDGVRLEVLDWGGSGTPLIFLPGLGDTAHVFDQFVPQLAADFRVYGITRRGNGNSVKPDASDTAPTRLADDVLDVIAALKLEKPALAGHAFGGTELTSIAARHPEKVAGLIYLEAEIDETMETRQEKPAQIDVPVLAIFSTPRTKSPRDAQIAAFAAGMKRPRIVKLPNAAHVLWVTHAGDAVREISNFVKTLPR